MSADVLAQGELQAESSRVARGSRFLIVRASRLLIVLVGLTVVTFFLVRLLPGGPAQTLVGVRASPEAIARVNERLGLAQPLPEQFLLYVRQLLQGNLGESFLSGASVTQIVGEHIAVTLQLIAYSILLVVVIGVPLAAVAAACRNRWPDLAVRAVAIFTFGFPSFWIGIILIAILSLRLGIFPSGGAGEGLVGRLTHLFLPALTMSLTFLAVVIRSMRTSLSELMRTDFVDLAKLKGVSQLRLWIAHILRIGVVPAITLIGMNAAYLLGTSAIVENVFAVPGLGQQLVAAVLQRDFLVVQGITLVFGVLVVLIAILVEALQSWLDPRLRGTGRG